MVCPKPTTFDEFIKICIEIDNAVHENELDKCHAKPGDTSKSTNCSQSKQATPAPTPRPAVLSTLSLPMGEPMQIDVTKTKQGLLTQAEREHRHANKLCMYCGGQHLIPDCPNMSDAAKKCYADKKASSPSGKA
ncbi:hypothetical protein BDN67DRAFT_1016031 [Paxillus ammoniavirescens]|nr:hypothetical protein BDN67DRAFT_1016031 [Paxillus ammoniavirescens]